MPRWPAGSQGLSAAPKDRSARRRSWCPPWAAEGGGGRRRVLRVAWHSGQYQVESSCSDTGFEQAGGVVGEQVDLDTAGPELARNGAGGSRDAGIAGGVPERQA